MCGKDVKCREERGGSALTLYCPRCERRLATLYGHIVVQ
jgi:hypothetical protein